jgi:hypothetical protein
MEENGAMLLVHPILAVLVVGMVVSTALFGWYYQRNQRRDPLRTHRAKGERRGDTAAHQGTNSDKNYDKKCYNGLVCSS